MAASVKVIRGDVCPSVKEYVLLLRQRDLGLNPSLPLISSVTLGKLLNFSEPQVSALVKGE